MPLYRLECTGEARELYSVEAANEDEARELFESGKCGQPFLTECSTDIHSIEEEDA